MTKYFKAIYQDNSSSLFSCNNQQAILLFGMFVASKGGRLVEIKKEGKK